MELIWRKSIFPVFDQHRAATFRYFCFVPVRGLFGPANWESFSFYGELSPSFLRIARRFFGRRADCMKISIYRFKQLS
jgi:hypothetical protein